MEREKVDLLATNKRLSLFKGIGLCLCFMLKIL
jgi:hypothetical protein